MTYSNQLYNEARHQVSSRSVSPLDEAIDTLRNVILEQFDSAGIRWTADLQLREAIGNLNRVCRHLSLERDTSREQVMKLKERITELENKDNQQMKKSREQQSAMVQAIKVRADKEKKNLDRKYKLQLKEDEKKILEKAKAEYVIMHQQLSEKMADHLKQVETAYIAVCEAHQSQLADTLEQFKISYNHLSDGFNLHKIEQRKLQEIIICREKQICELQKEAQKFEVRYMERLPLLATVELFHARCIKKIIENYWNCHREVQRAFESQLVESNMEHASEIEKINRKVKKIIDRKDRQISQMKQAVDTLNNQLDELTRMPTSD